MKLTSDNRRENLEILVREAGTAEALAARSNLSAVYISQIRSQAIDRKTNKPRNMGTAAARKLEAGMNKTRGWMDQEHAAIVRTGGDWPFIEISRAQYALLTDEQRGRIEERITMMLEDNGYPSN